MTRPWLTLVSLFYSLYSCFNPLLFPCYISQYPVFNLHLSRYLRSIPLFITRPWFTRASSISCMRRVRGHCCKGAPLWSTLLKQITAKLHDLVRPRHRAETRMGAICENVVVRLSVCLFCVSVCLLLLSYHIRVTDIFKKLGTKPYEVITVFVCSSVLCVCMFVTIVILQRTSLHALFSLTDIFKKPGGKPYEVRVLLFVCSSVCLLLLSYYKGLHCRLYYQ